MYLVAIKRVTGRHEMFRTINAVDYLIIKVRVTAVCVVWTYFNDVGRGDVGSEYRKPTPFVRKHEMCSAERTLTSKISAESNGIHYKGFRNAKIRGRELHLPVENACVSDTKSILNRISRDVLVRANGRGSKRPFAIGSGLGTKTRDQKRAL